MKEWDVSILISIYKREGLIAVPANNRPPRLNRIRRKIFEMGMTVKLVTECPDGNDQHELN